MSLNATSNAPVVLLPLEAETPPIARWADGSYRIGKTRIVLALVILECRDNRSPEEIAERFSTITLSEIYSIVAFYHRHRASVDAYVDDYLRRAEETHRKIQQLQPRNDALIQRLRDEKAKSHGSLHR